MKSAATRVAIKGISSMKKKYVQVGVGGRSGMFWDSIAVKFKDDCELLGICDNNPGRIAR